MPDPDPACNPITFILVALFFLLIHVILSLGDEAFMALGDTRIREMEDDGDRKIGRVRRILDNERHFSNRIRLGSLLNGSLCAATVLYGFTAELSNRLARWIYPHAEKPWATPLTDILSIVLLVLAVVLCLVVFAGRLTRRIALKNPEKTTKRVLGVFLVVYVVLGPLDTLCRLVAYPFLRLFGINPNENPDKVTEDDIRELMDAGEEIGAIEGAQKDMVNNIFAFDDITASEIMTPRTDVSAVEINTPIAEALRVGVDNGYSRIPVYEEDIDHIIGILYIKDLLPYVGQPLPKEVTIRHLLRDTHFVPDTKKCDDLFEEMNEKHLQMAIVVDEYGGVAGIVTMEDLLESIVGSMQDEFDNEEEEVTQVDEHCFEVDGSLNISELAELIEIELPQGDYDTVAGFIMDQLGHIPEEDEQAEVAYENVQFTVQRMDDRRIEQVLVRITPETVTPNAEEEN